MASHLRMRQTKRLLASLLAGVWLLVFPSFGISSAALSCGFSYTPTEPTQAVSAVKEEPQPPVSSPQTGDVGNTEFLFLGAAFSGLTALLLRVMRRRFSA